MSRALRLFALFSIFEGSKRRERMGLVVARLRRHERGTGFLRVRVDAHYQEFGCNPAEIKSSSGERFRRIFAAKVDIERLLVLARGFGRVYDVNALLDFVENGLKRHN